MRLTTYHVLHITLALAVAVLSQQALGSADCFQTVSDSKRACDAAMAKAGSDTDAAGEKFKASASGIQQEGMATRATSLAGIKNLQGADATCNKALSDCQSKCDLNDAAQAQAFNDCKKSIGTNIGKSSEVQAGLQDNAATGLQVGNSGGDAQVQKVADETFPLEARGCGGTICGEAHDMETLHQQVGNSPSSVQVFKLNQYVGDIKGGVFTPK